MLQVQFNLQHLKQTAYLFDQLPFSIAVHMDDFELYFHEEIFHITNSVRTQCSVHACDNKRVEA